MTWVRIDDHFDEHPKLAAAGVVTWGVWLAGIAYCNRNLTDGFIPWTVAHNLVNWDMLEPVPEVGRNRVWSVSIVSGMSGEDMETGWVIERLVRHELWDEVDGGYRIHDYGEYQPTKAEVLAMRDQKSKAGRKGGKRTQARRKASAQAGAKAEDQADRQAEVKPVPVPTPVPEVRPNVLSELDFIEPWQFFEERTKRKASQKVRDWLEDLHARFSRRELLSAMRAVPNPKESDWLKKVDAYLEGRAA